MMFGMVGQFLPGAAAVLLASNPVLLGIGAVFGGVQMLDEKKRSVATRRQSARGQLRQFVDDVQFEIGNEIGNRVRDIQRQLRDEFTERLGELQRTYTDTAKRAQADAEGDQKASKQRAAEVAAALQQLGQLDAALAKVAP